ncbi:nitrilase-related carbon-nitrogen hydrolase [Actinomadura kijaniata]|uniref:nitrilase-related carbon-nitrogen hydrolase n=1 Tax=Actinomadura kijaniata TaxID=46161 RepID=UPI0008324F6B|nr:nitrilase-related carbon-nitrogen hydrolase [Actinomadura kijaniata]
MAPVRVAAVQFAVGQDVAANLAACLRMIDRAAAGGARLVVLPEFCDHLSWYPSRATARERARRPGDAFLSAVAERARRHAVHVKLNVTLARDDGRTTGTNLLYGPDGTLLAASDKLVLMGAEGDHLDPGAAAGPVVATPLGRLGMYACMEGVLGEVCRDLAVRGAQVLLNGLNSFATDEASLHVPVRAAENRVWVVAANKVGPLLPAEHLPAISERLGVPPGWLHGAGESQVVAPDGTVLARAPRTGEAVVVADIDPAAADDKTRPDGTDVFAARRPELYGPIVSPPRPRTAPPGAKEITAAVARPAAPVEAGALAREAALRGADLVVLPELAFGPDASATRTARVLADALRGTSAHAVTSVRDGDSHLGCLVSAHGLVDTQRQLHRSARHAAWATRLGDGLEVFGLPWGRLAIVVGDDALYPETARLAAVADADVLAVPFTPREPWETRLGLLERAAENRLNVVAAGGDAGLVLALSGDFTLWTAWEGPFTGRISHPLVTRADGPVTLAPVHPARAVNRLVSKNTDLVAGRPWRAVASLAAATP